MSTNHAAYIATDTDRAAIYGVGSTPADAVADAHNWGATGELVTLPCSPALAAEVKDHGGAILWDEVDGVAMSASEAS